MAVTAATMDNMAVTAATATMDNMDILVKMLREEFFYKKPRGIRAMMKKVFAKDTFFQLNAEVPDCYRFDSYYVAMSRVDTKSPWTAKLISVDIDVDVDYEGQASGGACEEGVPFHKLTAKAQKAITNYVNIFNSLS